MEEAAASPETPAAARRSAGAVAAAWRLARLVAAIFLFVGALQLMKTGASGFSILAPGSVLVANAASAFGLGWLGALLVLSGSPVAATATALVAAGEGAAAGAARFTEIQGFMMLTGSRLGAAFVVLVTAVVYAMRGGAGRRKAPLSTAVICLLATALIYVPGAALGLALLSAEPFRSLDVVAPGAFADALDLVYGPLLEQAARAPGALVFVGGLLVLLVSFKLLDTTLPEVHPDRLTGGRGDLLRRKWPMFAIGAGVALVVMSVSVALTVLVPLVAKGYVRRDSIIPYIFGANITTLGDTLLAAFSLSSPGAVRIVLAPMVGTTIVSVVVLAFFYDRVRVAMWHTHSVFVKSPARLLLFTTGLFAIPLATIAASAIFA